MAVAGALALTGLTAPAARAQGRDSVVSIIVRGGPVINRARLDSVMILMRQLDQEPYGTMSALVVRQQIDSLMAGVPSHFSITSLPPTTARSIMPQGWLGISTQGPRLENVTPGGFFVQYFDYPTIVSVDPSSPAERAGIVPGDLLLAYNGVDVRGKRINLTELLEPDQKITIRVRHDRETKDYAVVIAKNARPAVAPRLMAGAPEFFVPGAPEADLRAAEMARTKATGGMVLGGPMAVIGPTVNANAMFGASFVAVSSEMAAALGIDSGLVVNQVAIGREAFRSGLRPGDRIAAADGRSIISFRQLYDIVLTVASRGDHTLPLDVVRDRKAQKLTLTW